MTRKQDEQNAPSGAERVTRRGLGTDARATTATGEFPLVWPQLPESPELPPSRVAAEPSAVRDDEVTSSWQRSQSRGPEYHPPALPAAARERPAPGTASSGTYRVGAPPTAPRVPAVLDADGGSSPSAPPVERPVGRMSAVPRRVRFGSKRLWWPVAAGLVVGSALALTLVRVPVRAWGVLKTTGTPETLSAQLSGSVAKLRVATGDRVEPGDVIVEIRSLELESNLDSRRAELERLRQELEGSAREEQAVLARSSSTLARRRALLEQRLQLKDAEIEQRKALLDGLTARVTDGAAPATDVFEPTAAVQAAREARLGIADELSQLDLEVSDRRGAEQASARARRARLADTESRVRLAEALLGSATVRAPAAGWVESVLVTPGSSVQTGAELARLVPRSAPRTVVALLAPEDAAEVTVGEAASVELAPPSRQGSAVFAARVRYISREVVPAGRVQGLLGGPSTGGFVQLELELLNSAEFQAFESQLRSGWRALVTLPTPHRRLGSVLSAAVRQWWDFGIWG
jgi:multidrug resistance efflux pump